MIERESIELKVECDGKIRIDRYIADSGIISRNQIKERDLKIFLKDKEIKHSAKAVNGALYTVSWDREVEVKIEPEEIPLDIVFEDENCVVISKDQGVVVHPSIGNYTGTLVQGLLYYIKNLSDNFDGDILRPGIVHRLDKDTSGLIITAKNSSALAFLATQFKDRTNIKEYLAIVKGCPEKKRGTIKSYIARDIRDRKKFMSTEDENNGKYAETDYVVLSGSEDYSLVKLILKTGRTHQIRVHLKSLGYPILGDPIYSRADSKYKDATLMLHSFHLGIILPEENEMRDFYSPVPERMLEIIKAESMDIPTILEGHID